MTWERLRVLIGQPILPSGCPKDKGTRIPKSKAGKFERYGIRS